jgi:hypothetical protein
VRDNPEDYNCKKCKNSFYCDEKAEWPKSKGAASFDLIEIERGGYIIKSQTCLIPQITHRTNYLFKLHNHYHNGLPLLSGGLYDQPALYLEAMEIIER